MREMEFKGLCQLEPWKKVITLVNLRLLDTSQGLLQLELLKTVNS
jgi:hypothetical protein